jgi:uncharacterized iron-regulated protein
MKRYWIISEIISMMIFFTLSLLSVQKTLSSENYQIYSAGRNTTISTHDIVKDFSPYDVLIFGEEHNDSVGHYLEFSILKELYEEYGKEIILSLEFFEKDVQTILDEYLTGKITKENFKKDGRIWSNYRDYDPLIEFAKENGIPILASNAPFRYVQLANSRGQEALQSLSETAKSYIAPLPYDTSTGKYLKKLKKIMEEVREYTIEKDSMTEDMQKEKKMDLSMVHLNINQGQSLWNATMAYSIIQALGENPTKKVFHINGRMHSDEYFGVPEHLKKYNEDITSLVISAFSEDSFPNTNFDNYRNLGDYIIITDPQIPRTFEQ